MKNMFKQAGSWQRGCARDDYADGERGSVDDGNIEFHERGGGGYAACAD